LIVCHPSFRDDNRELILHAVVENKPSGKAWAVLGCGCGEETCGGSDGGCDAGDACGGGAEEEVCGICTTDRIVK
jgi:hypothetical protein